VLVCYLDDSGKDPQNRVTSLGGFIAPDVCWEAFELTVEPIFRKYEVDVLHAKKLHGTDGPFRGWKINKKRAFVAEVCQKMQPFIPLGICMSAVKDTYQVRAKESSRKRTVTAYTFCFNVIVQRLFTHAIVGQKANEDGVAFVLESGHESNGELERSFDGIQRKHGHEISLHSLTFVGKKKCRAIQVADLIAFYGRRHGAAQEKTAPEGRPGIKPDPMLEIIQHYVPIDSFVATEFDQGAQSSGTPFQIPLDRLKSLAREQPQ